MPRRRTLVGSMALIVLLTLILNTPGFSQTPPRADATLLQQDAIGDVEITWNPQSGTPGFIRGVVPLSVMGLQGAVGQNQAAHAFVERYAALFGVNDTSQELVTVKQEVDDLGMIHVTLRQVYNGIAVYGAGMQVHLQSDGAAVVAASSGFVPNIDLRDTTPHITADQALAIAYQALPNAMLVSGPTLLVYPTRYSDNAAQLAWMVELRDDAVPARNMYVVDAQAWAMLDVIELLNTSAVLPGPSTDRVPLPATIGIAQAAGKNRATYDANHSTVLPGTLARSEGQEPVTDADVNNAHDFAGETYDYYQNTHGRNSYDDQGATIISTANYGRSYANAFWNGTQMVYGDGLAVRDVVAHELTHAVTEHTANLEYQWQSGALNESFSDIFGAMVDRDDWLIGEDLPATMLAGRKALRDMQDPGSLGYPAHADEWKETCSDHEGVHTNSSIINKAYYNVATATGKDQAERIFYRMLTVYLQSTASLEDARSAALQAATDLYGSGSTAYNAVRDGFNAVGIDGEWNPPENNCSCAATNALAGSGTVAEQVSALETATTLYRVRDEVLSTTKAGTYYRELYEEHTGRITYLLLLEPELRTTGSGLLHTFTPGLTGLAEGRGATATVTPGMTEDVSTFLHALAAADRTHGGEELAQVLEQEMSQLDLDQLAGMTFEQAWAVIKAQHPTSAKVLYLPLLRSE